MQAALLRPREKNLSNGLSRSDLNIHPSKNLQLCMNVGLLWKLSKEKQCFILKAYFNTEIKLFGKHLPSKTHLILIQIWMGGQL